jgi:hypothetical protein
VEPQTVECAVGYRGEAAGDTGKDLVCMTGRYRQTAGSSTRFGALARLHLRSG